MLLLLSYRWLYHFKIKLGGSTNNGLQYTSNYVVNYIVLVHGGYYVANSK